MTETCKTTDDLNVFDHLGINLYSNIAAVPTEAVVNAGDAVAEKVNIRIAPDGKWIEITNDGVGMSVTDINDKCLRVGCQRPEEADGSVTPKGWPVMGRKGLGKLSSFSIADTIEWRSAKDSDTHRRRMTMSGSTQRASK